MLTSLGGRLPHAGNCRRNGRALLVSALLLAMPSIPLEAQGTRSVPKTAADSMLAMIRARAGVDPTPTEPRQAASRPAAAPTRVVRSAPAAKPVVERTVQPVAKPDSQPVTIAVSKDSTPVVAQVAVAAAPAKDTTPAPAPTQRPTPTPTPTPAPTPAAAPAQTAAAPKPPTPAPAAAPAAARIAEVGFGTLKFDGLLQFWFGASNTSAASSFRIRRAEIKVSGRISPIVGWAMMFDVSKPLSLSNSTTNVGGSTVVSSASVNQGSRLMQDALLTVDVAKSVHVDAGQFRLPLGNVGSTSSAALESIERPMFQADRARGGALGDIRDIGFVVRGNAGTAADYWIGAFNGGGETQNTTDANNQKSLVGRMTFRTPVTGLRVGASGLYSGVDSVTPLKKDRYGAEITFVRGPYLARAEMQHGVDGTVDREGGFVLLGFRPIRPLQLVARVDAWDPDVRRDDTAATVRATDYMIGSTWQLAGDNARLQLNLSRRRFADDLLRSTTQLLVNLQASW